MWFEKIVPYEGGVFGRLIKAFGKCYSFRGGVLEAKVEGIMAKREG